MSSCARCSRPRLRSLWALAPRDLPRAPFAASARADEAPRPSQAGQPRTRSRQKPRGGAHDRGKGTRPAGRGQAESSGSILLDLVNPRPLDLPYGSTVEKEITRRSLEQKTTAAVDAMVASPVILTALAKALGVSESQLRRLATEWRSQWPNPHGIFGVNHVDFPRQRTMYADEGETALMRVVLSALMRYVATTKTPLALAAQRVLDAVDMTRPEAQHSGARAMKRHFVMHVGPTNSGKTYNALVALARARRGVYAGPLRLLAHEIAFRFNTGQIGGLEGVPRPCNLVTGEEQRLEDVNAGLVASTVEMVNTASLYDVAVIDEIQLIGDASRGSAWTRAVLGLRAKEIHLCGEASAVELVKRILARTGDSIEVRRYERLNGLEIDEGPLGDNLETFVRPGDCIISFSRPHIFAIKATIEEKTPYKVACCYGALPPEVRDQQARLFNEGALDIMVATDAIGMGLNLKIRRTIFETTTKFTRRGAGLQPLPVPAIKQIAGRAGRYQVKDSAASLPDIDQTPAPANASPGIVSALFEEDHARIRQAFASPPVELLYASVAPELETLVDLRNVVANATTYADLVALCLLLGHVDGPYRVPAAANRGETAASVSGLAGLTLGERDFFSNAPTDQRTPEGVAALLFFANAKRRGRPVDVGAYARKTGILAAVAAPPSPTNLRRLEAANKVLVLYRWLSYRDPLIFRDGDEALDLSGQVNDALSKALAVSRPASLRHRDRGAAPIRSVRDGGRGVQGESEAVEAETAVRGAVQ